MEDGLEGASQMTPEKTPPTGIGKEQPIENKLSFGRKDLDKVLNEKQFNPNSLIGLFEKDYGSEYAASAGVWEGYTIKQHTLMVMGQYEKYFVHNPLPANMDRNLFRTTLALHDIGKPEAIKMGGKHLQHEYTEPKMNSILSQLEFSQQEKDMALAVATGDPIGNSLKTGDIEKSVEEIVQSARKANVPPEEFFDLLTVFYRCDAGSYTEDAGGKRSLDHLFEFDGEKRELRFAPHTNETIKRLRSKIQSLKETNLAQEKETWQMTRREFGNNFYLQGMHEHRPYCDHDKSNDTLGPIRKSGTITEGLFFSARSNDNIINCRKTTEAGGVFLVVRADSLHSKRSGRSMNEIRINKKDKQAIPYVAEVPLGLDPHRYLVHQAIKEGRKVPREVLEEDYPYALLTNQSSPEEIIAAIEKSHPKKELWKTTRDEFGENYYLHGTTKDKADQIRQAGGIQRGSFINVAQDEDHTAIAYATDAPNQQTEFSKSGRGSKEGSIFIGHIDDVLTREQQAEKIQGRNGYDLLLSIPSWHPKTVNSRLNFRDRTVPYVAEIPPVEDPHKYLIEQALMQGKSVPPDVLADYPELEKTAKVKKEIASIPNSGSPTTEQELGKPHPIQESPKGWRRISSGISNAFSRLTQRIK